MSAIRQNDMQRGAYWLELSVELNRQIGNRANEASALNNLGFLAYDRRDLTTARMLFERALQINQESGNRPWEAINVYNIGQVLREQGDTIRARARVGEALQLYRSLNLKTNTAECLEMLAAIAMDEDQPNRAARLLGAMMAYKRRNDLPETPCQEEVYQPTLTAIQAALGEEACATAQAAGATLTTEAAFAEALDELSPGSVREK